MADRRIIAIFNGIQLHGKWTIEPTITVKQITDQFGTGSALSEEYKDDFMLKLEEVPMHLLKLNGGLGQPNPKLFGSNIGSNPEGALIYGYDTTTTSYPKAKITNHSFKTLVGFQSTDKITLEFHIIGNHA